MVGRAMRRILRSTLVVVLAGAWLVPRPAFAAVTWGPQRTLKDWAWSTGSSLAVTGSGSSVMVYQLLSSDFEDGHFATDHGPYEGVFVTSSDDRGLTWSAPSRVSQPARHADRGSLAADGTTLYAAWVTRTSYDHDSPSAHRVLYLRARHGGEWGPTIRLSKQKGRVDFPSVAAAAGHVYVVWTDANTGDVRLAASADGGSSWTRSVLGKAKASDPGGEGRVGLPTVGAGGSDVGVAWLATGAGGVRAVASTNAGRTWGNAVALTASGGSANEGSPSVTGSDDRLAFSWTTPSGVWARVWSSGSWAASSLVAPLGAGSPYHGGYDVQVSLVGSDVVGVAWSGCRSSTCDTASAQARVHLLWSESSDGGAHWSSPSVVRASTQADQLVNDGASAAWLDAHTRIVTYAGAVSGLTTYRLYARIGNGNP